MAGSSNIFLSGVKGIFFPNLIGWLSFFFIIAELGCVTPVNSHSTTDQLRKRVRDLEWTNAKQRRQLAEHKKNTKRKQTVALKNPSDQSPLSPLNPATKRQSHKPGIALVLPQKENSRTSLAEAKRDEVWGESSGEQFLYGQVLEDYRRSDLSSLEKTTNLLIKGYPQSVFADNALYLTGTLALFQKDHDKSLRYFHRVGQEYPMGNKVVAALYGEAMLYKKLGHSKKSEVLMKKIMKYYPGSPEESLAANEFKR